MGIGDVWGISVPSTQFCCQLKTAVKNKVLMATKKSLRPQISYLERRAQLYLFWVLVTLEAQTVKNLPTMQETQVQSLGWEDPLEKEIATHSSICAWKIPWTEEPGGYSPWGHRVGLYRATNTKEHYKLYK